VPVARDVELAALAHEGELEISGEPSSPVRRVVNARAPPRMALLARALLLSSAWVSCTAFLR